MSSFDDINNGDELDYTPDIYTLIDEDGKEQSFELIDTLEEGGERYYAMVPYFENPDDLVSSDSSLVILKSEFVDNEETLVTIDSEDEYDRIGAIFMQRIERMYEEMEEDECSCGDDCCDGCHHCS